MLELSWEAIPFYPLVVDVVTKFTREGVLSELLLYAVDLVLMSETFEGLWG